MRCPRSTKGRRRQSKNLLGIVESDRNRQRGIGGIWEQLLQFLQPDLIRVNSQHLEEILARSSPGYLSEIGHILVKHPLVRGRAEDGAAVKIGVIGLTKIGLKGRTARGIIQKREDDVAEDLTVYALEVSGSADGCALSAGGGEADPCAALTGKSTIAALLVGRSVQGLDNILEQSRAILIVCAGDARRSGGEIRGGKNA